MTDDLKFFTDGAAYERLMGRWSRPVGEKFLDWLRLPQGLRWLDVGCGTGAFTETVAMRCAPAELQGIDPAEVQIAYAKSRDAAKQARFQVGDAQALPFEESRFDVATMALVISFIPDPARAVAELARVVRPGGCVATYMWDIPGGGLPYHPIVDAVRALGLSGGMAPPGSGVTQLPEMRSLWERTGLQAIDACRIDITVTFSSFDDFWGSATLLESPVGRLVGGLSEADRERLHGHLDDTLTRDSRGAISFGAFANAVRGRVPG